MIGQKFVYARSEEGVMGHQVRRALELLAKAKLCSIVHYTAGSGLPLGAQTKDSFRKAVLLDVGVLHALLDTPASAAFPSLADLAPPVRGQIAEQMAG